MSSSGKPVTINSGKITQVAETDTANVGIVQPSTTDADLNLKANGTGEVKLGVSGATIRSLGNLIVDENFTSDDKLLQYAINGLSTTWVSTTTVRIEVGSCRSDDDTIDLVLTSSKDAVITSSGAGGLDTGSEAASTWYFIYLIYNPTTTTYAALLSASSSSPTMPSGYTKKRRVGSVRNDDSSDFKEFFCTIMGTSRLIQFAAYDYALSNGSSTAWVSIDCSASIPSTSTVGFFDFLVSDADAFCGMRTQIPTRDTYAFFVRGYYYGSNTVLFETDSTQNVYYRVESTTDDADIRVYGYLEAL